MSKRFYKQGLILWTAVLGLFGAVLLSNYSTSQTMEADDAETKSADNAKPYGIENPEFLHGFMDFEAVDLGADCDVKDVPEDVKKVFPLPFAKSLCGKDEEILQTH